MKKWKDIPKNERWMLAFIVLLIIFIILRWGTVSDGISRGFNWYRSDETETAIPADSIPPEQTDALRMETEE